MPRKRYTPEEIIQHLRTVEVEQANGHSLDDAARKIGVSKQSIVRWRSEFGGLRIDQAKRLKELEQENARLKRVVANQALVSYAKDRFHALGENSIHSKIPASPNDSGKQRLGFVPKIC